MPDLKSLVNQTLSTLAGDIEARAVRIVDRDHLVAWGKLRRGIKTKVHPDKLQIDVFVESSIAPYAQYVHEGRKPGKMPPVSMIEEWARKKRLLSSESRGVKLSARINSNAKLSAKQQQLADRYHSLAWAIARKMKHHELKPRRFLIEAILESLKNLK
ncbi:hypothetical protein MASR1M36_08640 [Candidatus Cloacimonadaceae bacterium]